MNQSQCALVVDAVHDQRQVVIKGLESNYGAIPGVSAATVLGDGQIALILDADALTSNRNSGPAAPVAACRRGPKQQPATGDPDASPPKPGRPRSAEFVAFQAGGQSFSLDITHVREIRRWTAR
jgi:chemotaxis signal transduction protein